MALVSRTRIAGILAISLLILSAPGAMAGTNYQPDASIRLGSGPYVGESVFNLDASGQSATGGGLVGEKLTFWIKIRNVGALADTFKVKRSSGYTNGYRVRYYNAGGTDVTGQVTVGSFTTPSLNTGDEYVMRATVKIKSWATEGSFTSRLITVSSVHLPEAKDAVRFTGELDFDLDQSQTAVAGRFALGTAFGVIRSAAQTFTAGISGDLTRVALWPRQDSSGWTLEIRTTSSGLPTTTVLASTTITSTTSFDWVTTTFSTPASVVSGTQYAIVVTPPSVLFSDWGSSNTDVYAGGTVAGTLTTLTSWFTVAQDLGFKTYVTP